eukprot:scaffold3134_cov111-Skeletonema_menzelii.AAC.4
MDSSKKIKKDKEADDGGAGAPGDRCGGDGDKPPSKKIKTEDRDDGGDDDDDDEDSGEGGWRRQWWEWKMEIHLKSGPIKDGPNYFRRTPRKLDRPPYHKNVDEACALEQPYAKREEF